MDSADSVGPADRRLEAVKIRAPFPPMQDAFTIIARKSAAASSMP